MDKIMCISSVIHEQYEYCPRSNYGTKDIMPCRVTVPQSHLLLHKSTDLYFSSLSLTIMFVYAGQRVEYHSYIVNSQYTFRTDIHQQLDYLLY